MEKKEKEMKVNITSKIYTTKELATALGMTGKQVRRYLRKMSNYNDGKYTNYAWSKTDFDKVVKIIKATLDSKKEKEEQAE